jgi:hypothetical protein
MKSSQHSGDARAQRVCVLGATGSVGKATLDVVAAHPDRFEVFALTANSRLDDLFAQCVRFRPRLAAVADAADARTLSERLRGAGIATEVMSGAGALCELAAHPEADTVMAAIVGAAGSHRAWPRRLPASACCSPTRKRSSSAARSSCAASRAAAPRCCRSTASTLRSTSACPTTARPGTRASPASS